MATGSQAMSVRHQADSWKRAGRAVETPAACDLWSRHAARPEERRSMPRHEPGDTGCSGGSEA
jgi:hypothetical protein